MSDVVDGGNVVVGKSEVVVVVTVSVMLVSKPLSVGLVETELSVNVSVPGELVVDDIVVVGKPESVERSPPETVSCANENAWRSIRMTRKERLTDTESAMATKRYMSYKKEFSTYKPALQRQYSLHR
jgi:hypothetical protein